MTAAADDHRRNNFDAIRISAAIGVLVSHSFAVVGRAEPAVNGVKLGNFSVLLFFGISGYLVTQSWRRDPRVLQFAFKRAMRIAPGLIVVVVASTMILGPFLTTLNPGDYFSDFATGRYMVENLTLWHMQFDLPGIFAAVPFPNVVNGSLWTLPSEVHAYAVLAVVSALALMTHARAFWVLLAAAAGCVAFPGLVNVIGSPVLFVAFIVGVALSVYGDEIPWSWPLAACAVVAWVFAPVGPGASYFALAALAPYLVLLAAFHAPLAAPWLAGHDYSYGTYLWAFPVQQMIAQGFPRVGPLAMIVAATAVTVPIAAASWRFIERPALKLRTSSARSRRQSPVA